MLPGHEAGSVKIGDGLGNILGASDPARGMLLAILRSMIGVRTFRAFLPGAGLDPPRADRIDANRRAERDRERMRQRVEPPLAAA